MLLVAAGWLYIIFVIVAAVLTLRVCARASARPLAADDSVRREERYERLNDDYNRTVPVLMQQAAANTAKNIEQDNSIRQLEQAVAGIEQMKAMGYVLCSLMFALCSGIAIPIWTIMRQNRAGATAGREGA